MISGAQDIHGNPAAPEQLLDLAATAQVCRQGVVVEPSEVDDASHVTVDGRTGAVAAAGVASHRGYVVVAGVGQGRARPAAHEAGGAAASAFTAAIQRSRPR